MRRAGAHALLAVGMLLTSAVFLSAQTADERAVKAGFIFNLTKYVEWTAPGNELSVCTVGDGAMADVLHKMLSGKVSETRTIHVVISPTDEQLTQCQVIYVAPDASKKTRSILEKIHDKNILTVSDMDSFTRDGGMIGLVRNGERIQIEINLEAVQQAHLRLSSRLLNVAVIVHSVAARKD